MTNFKKEQKKESKQINRTNSDLTELQLSLTEGAEIETAVPDDKFVQEIYGRISGHIRCRALPGFGKTYFLSKMHSYYRHLEQPVIWFSLKNINADSYKGALEQFRQKMKVLFTVIALKYSINLEKYDFDKEVDLEWALIHLIKVMRRELGSPVIMLVDDCHMPLQTAYAYGYYKDMKRFVRTFFNCPLKDNVDIHHAIFTEAFHFFPTDGIYQVLTAEQFYFGFTKKQVATLLPAAFGERERLLKQLKKQYGGYKFFSDKVFHPRSVLGFIRDNRISATSGIFKFPSYIGPEAALLDKFLEKTTQKFRLNLKFLIKTGKLTIKFPSWFLKSTFDHLMEEPDYLWHFLIASGYLAFRQTSRQKATGEIPAKITIPNDDLYRYFSWVVKRWFPEEEIFISQDKQLLLATKQLLTAPSQTFFTSSSQLTLPDRKLTSKTTSSQTQATMIATDSPILAHSTEFSRRNSSLTMFEPRKAAPADPPELADPLFSNDREPSEICSVM